MKYEFLLAVFVLYQLSIYIFMRRWVGSREDRLMKLAVERRARSGQCQHTMMHVQWRRKVVLGIVALMIVLIFAMVLGTGSSIEGYSWSWFMVGVTIIVALSWAPWGMVAEAYGIAMVLDDSSMTRRSPWSKDDEVEWSKVESVSYSWFWAWFTIRTRESTVHVTTVIGGLEKCAQAIVTHVPAKRIRVPNEIMSKALRGPFRY